MKAKGNLAVPKQLAAFMKRGESSTLEFKRSTAELQGAMRSLCAFINGAGGMVIIGVGPDGRLLGQDVSDATQQKIAAALDRFPVPLDALREILLNAVTHRDYSDYSGYVAILVFDDRIEIQSHGLLPWGVTVEQLSGPHRSKLRNPLIAEAFHRTGAVEVWGRGTNRVIAMCEKHDAALPIFEERQGFFIVTFNVSIAEAAEITSKAPVTAPVTAPVRRLLELLFSKGTLGNLEILAELGLKNRRRMRENYIAPALGAGLIEYTIPDKPNSRLQKYRLTLAGRAVIEGEGKA